MLVAELQRLPGGLQRREEVSPQARWTSLAFDNADAALSMSPASIAAVRASS